MLLVQWQSGAATGGSPGRSSWLPECLLRYHMSGLLFFGLKEEIMVLQLTSMDLFTTLSFNLLFFGLKDGQGTPTQVRYSTQQNIFLVTSLQYS